MSDAERGPKRLKCLVWDLDNTLWQGVLLEGDPVEEATLRAVATDVSENTVEENSIYSWYRDGQEITMAKAAVYKPTWIAGLVNSPCRMEATRPRTFVAALSPPMACQGMWSP